MTRLFELLQGGVWRRRHALWLVTTLSLAVALAAAPGLAQDAPPATPPPRGS